jgi:nicotinate-nucleotide pyrophosphorylase (carboxylating)
MDWHSSEIENLIRRAIEEDLGPGDATSLATIPANATARARIIARAPMVCAGLPAVERVFQLLDANVEIEFIAKDGDIVEKPSDLLCCKGRARPILTGERTALNFLAHLSGIATLTRRFVERLAGTNAKIRDTRKTTPGLRKLEKYAVQMGGGVNHRFGLYDAILLKENHIALAGGVKQALDMAHAYASAQITTPAMSAYEATGLAKQESTSASLPVQIEVRDERELREALEAGAEAVLLDNMTPEAAKHCVELTRTIRKDCLIEISGGVTLDNARSYAETGADFLSSGALTQAAPAANLSLLVDSITER